MCFLWNVLGASLFTQGPLHILQETSKKWEEKEREGRSTASAESCVNVQTLLGYIVERYECHDFTLLE